MGFIKVIFWLSISVVLAYFMSDIKVNGKTIKENIDYYLQSTDGQEMKEKAGHIVSEGLDKTISVMNKAKEGLSDKTQEFVDEAEEEITAKEKDELEKILK